MAILDLTDAGLQPMSSEDGRFWIIFNGEVYNYIELRGELAQHGHCFRTRTDTEVVLAAYRQWGSECFARFNGMWGLAIVDTRQRKLVLSRDRLGIKPLYVWADGQSLAFASEMKQLLSLPALGSPVANMDAVIEYIDTGYERPPDTFVAGVEAFPPGRWREIALDEPTSQHTESFWFPERLAQTTHVDRRQVTQQVRGLFENSTRLRLRSDVPVGVCLSGGIDSSAIFGQVQTFQRGSKDSTHAFTAAFEDLRFDERKYVKAVLERHGGRSHYAFPSAEAFLEDFEAFIYHHDEPPTSLSQYAGWSVMRLVHESGVPVLLNGQGGDELFSGYWPAYYLYLKRRLRQGPQHVARHLIGALLPGGNATLIGLALRHWRQYRHRMMRDGRALLRRHWRSHGLADGANWAQQAQQLEPEQYRVHELRHVHLPRLLKWDDRNCMAFSIEGRYPLLDHHLVERALTLPPELNLRRGWNKLLLREALGHLLPSKVQWRRSKLGFVTPQSEWIRTALRPVLAAWAACPSEQMTSIVDRHRLRMFADGLFRSHHIHRLDQRHYLLVRLFFLDRWMRVFKIQLPQAFTAPTPFPVDHLGGRHALRETRACAGSKCSPNNEPDPNA